MSSGISFSGLSSGLDTGSIVESLVSVARQPITRLQAKQSDYKSQSSLISNLESKLSALRTAAKTLDTPTELRALTASSSDETKLTAVASGRAVSGRYEITVTSLCQAERTYSDAFSAKDQAGLFGAGTLTIQIGTESVQVDVNDTTDTLESIASQINDKSSNVTAQVMSTGTGYRLVVNGNKSGAANQITFTEGGTLALDLDDAANEAQAAADAEIVLDEMTITRSTNEIDDAIPGVVLNLASKTVAGTPVNLVVSSDEDTMKTKVQGLITAYNSVVEFINGQLKYNGEVRTDTLMGDAATRSVKYRLQRILGDQVGTLTEPYNALSRVGVKSGSDGKLSLDSSVFSEALSDDLDAVADLFSTTDGDEATDNDGVAVRLVRSIDEMIRSTDGLLPTRTAGLASRVEDIEKQISRLEDNVSTYELGLKRQFSALEELLSGLQSQSTFLSQQFR